MRLNRLTLCDGTTGLRLHTVVSVRYILTINAIISAIRLFASYGTKEKKYDKNVSDRTVNCGLTECWSYNP